jgi:hypothetical protein
MVFGKHAANEKIFVAIGVSMIYKRTTLLELEKKKCTEEQIKIIANLPTQ